MKTYLFEARQGPGGISNWGKFMVGVFDDEWSWRSGVDDGRALLQACGWWHPDHVWVMDLQTGEGCYVRPGGCAHADLEKHAVWVCPMFEPWLEWLYERVRKTGIEGIGSLPRVVDLPDAEFAFAGHRRPGPDQVTIPHADFSDLLVAAAILASLPSAPAAEAVQSRLADLLARYDVRLDVT